MTTEDEVTLEEEEWFHDADRSSIIDPWHQQQRWGLVSSSQPRNYRKSASAIRNTRWNIYDDLHSKKEREDVWKATEWLVRLNSSWTDYARANSFSTDRRIKTHSVMFVVVLTFSPCPPHQRRHYFKDRR